MDSTEMELVLLRNLFAASEQVAHWDFDDLDPEPQDDMEAFKEAVLRIRQFIDLREIAEKEYQAAMRKNFHEGR